jgi:hypothetical protein
VYGVGASVRDFARNHRRTRVSGRLMGGLETVMTAAFVLMMIYRLMALFVAAMMIYVVWRERDWRPQLYAALVLVPFLLRGLGVK